MTDDIKDRLASTHLSYDTLAELDELCAEAADRIAALEAERDRLREALLAMVDEARLRSWHVMSNGQGLAYSAANAGLLQFMRAIAVEYGPKGIRANAVSPGSVKTANRSWTIRQQKDPQVFDKLAKWYPVGRVGKPEDIAAAIAFLAADEAAFVNGANLVVDGGLTAGLAPMIQEFVIEDD